MLKKVAVGILSLTLLAAGGGAVIYQASQQNAVNTASTPQGSGQGYMGGRQAVSSQVQGDNQQQAPDPVAQAMVGEPWTATGTVGAVDEYGLTLVEPDGTEIYVELGPPTYWQAQGVTINPGDEVTIDGFVNGDQFHAGTVTLSNGQQIVLRDASGQPLWSGAAARGSGSSGQGGGWGGHGQGGNGQGNGQGGGNANGLQDGNQVPQPQAQVDEWVTVEGTITALAQNQITLETASGETQVLQLGQPRFLAEQGVTLAVGDELAVLGFYEGTVFNAGEITRLATGERIMLRDPNGRPLWGGPGRQGQGGSGGRGWGGNGSGSQGQGQSGRVAATS